MNLESVSLLTILALALFAVPAVAGTMNVKNLRCEYRNSPMGIDSTSPRLSWTVDSQERSQRQSAYQILVASSEESLKANKGDLWDTGKTASNRTNQIEYSGKPLTSRMQCFWKVRVWDKSGKPSEYSKPELWSMGLLKPDDWKAEWIGYDKYRTRPPNPAAQIGGLQWVRLDDGANTPAVYLRREFEIPAGKITSAAAYFTADHTCDISINGKPIGRAVRWESMSPIDISAALKEGKNVIALTVTQEDGYRPMALGHIVIEAAENALNIPLDDTWKAAQKSAEGWDKVGFDDSGWKAASMQGGTPWGTSLLAANFLPPPPYLRKSFEVEKTVKRATLYATALGLYEMHLNGKRVGDDYFTPGWTDYNKRVQYNTCDVTKMLKYGDNAIGAILGDGWYAGCVGLSSHMNNYKGNPRLLVQLEVEFTDGTRQIIATDDTWQAAIGPILHADLLGGCAYDARQAVSGWDKAEFVAENWQPVDLGVSSGNKSFVVEANPAEPSRAFEQLPAKKVTEIRPGAYLFDLGQNMVGWVRLKVKGKPGQKITVRHGEMLNPNGALYTTNLRGAMAADIYYLSGKGEEVLEPYFTFHGFQYVEISGLESKPNLQSVTGIVAHSDMKPVGNFECSNPLVNQLAHNIKWGQKGNYLEIPTDCPQRDERLGWTGDTQFFIPTAVYNFDVAGFFTRWLFTMCEDSQREDGAYAEVAPCLGNYAPATAWGDAALLCTYNIYTTYGDTRVIKAHYRSMGRYLEFLATKSKNNITTLGGFGDWLNLGSSAKTEVMDTAYYAHLTNIMAEMAEAIGEKADAAKYRELSSNIKAAFISEFITPDGRIKESSQTGYALAFTMGLVPDELKAKMADQYEQDVKSKDYHLGTGFIGTPRLLPGLHIAGKDDVAYKLLLQESYPSWLFQVKLGATTMWERWDGWTPDRGFQDIGMNSFNHYAFGAVGEYIFGTVGGIQSDGPGYRHILIAPAIEDGLTWAKASYESINGPIATSWKKDGGNLTLEVTIPANTTATVYIPAKDPASVTESGKPAASAEGVKFMKMDGKCAVFEVGSGKYAFGVK
ncbi:MAG: family 78 glycoside hydrolase catalytic domain [Armatimonadetes bacterium]|nr:family 78 glycoside hydrolase catalytic domain [Armatimonadota bacterium]